MHFRHMLRQGGQRVLCYPYSYGTYERGNLVTVKIRFAINESFQVQHEINLQNVIVK